MSGTLQDQSVLVIGHGGGLARSLALELAPVRVNAISPGVIDGGGPLT